MLACITCSVAACILRAAADGEREVGSRYRVLAWSGDGREGRTRGQASGSPGLGRAGFASPQMGLFAAEAGLEGAWVLQAGEGVLLTAWGDDWGWGRGRKGGMRGVHWGPDVVGTTGLCLAAAERKGCRVRVAVLSVSSASLSGTLLPFRNCCQAAGEERTASARGVKAACGERSLVLTGGSTLLDQQARDAPAQ